MCIWTKKNCVIVYIATDAELKNIHYYQRLWIAVRNVNISRRDWLDEMADAFRDAHVDILYRSSQPYNLPEVDHVFDDHDMRWLSAFLRAETCGKKPVSKSLHIERLRMLDLYFRVKHPKIARHFSE